MTENKKTDREKLIELMREAYHFANNKCNNTVSCMVCDNRKYGFDCREVDMADYLLSHGVTFEKYGEWVAAEKCNHKPCRIKNPEKWKIRKCSECGYSNGIRQSNYCPNCGAKMKGAVNNE